MWKEKVSKYCMNLHLVISWCLSMLRKMFIYWISSNIFSCHTKKVICKDCKRKLDFCKMWQEKFLGCTCFHYFHSSNSCLNEAHQSKMNSCNFDNRIFFLQMAQYFCTSYNYTNLICYFWVLREVKNVEKMTKYCLFSWIA